MQGESGFSSPGTRESGRGIGAWRMRRDIAGLRSSKFPFRTLTLYLYLSLKDREGSEHLVKLLTSATEV